MSRPSRDHIAFSQISTAMSSLAYPYLKHDFKQDAKPKPSLSKKNETNNLHDIAPFLFPLIFSNCHGSVY